MKGKPTMAKSHQQLIKNAINRKRKKKQQREEKQRRKLLENSTIFKRKFDSYYRYLQTHFAKKAFVIAGVALLVAPVVQASWGLYIVYKDYGFDYSPDFDEVDSMLILYVQLSYYIFLSYLLSLPCFIFIGERYDLVKKYFVRGDRMHRVRAAILIFISIYVACEARVMRLNEKPGYGLDNTMFQFIRFSTIASMFLLANNLSYVNEIVLREPRDKNTGFINRVVIPSMSRCVNHCCCLKSSYRTDLKGRGLARLLQDTKYEKDLLKALVTMPGWKLKPRSVAKVKRQRTRVNRYLRALEDMKVDKAIVMLKRIYNGDLSQATVAEICIGCVHLSIYDRFHEFENYNKRIQHEFDCIQNIYSKWRDLLDDLKAVGDAGMVLQKWLRIMHFIEGNKNARTLKERENHGKAKILRHIFKYQRLIQQKNEMLCRLSFIPNDGIDVKCKDWLLACRCANRICPIPLDWKKIKVGNGFTYEDDQGRKMRNRTAANVYLHEKAFPLPWDTQWTPKNIAKAFHLIKASRAKRMKMGLEQASLKYLTVNNPEIKKLLKREKLASLGEATIYEKCLVYETDLIKGMEHEFERYRKEATVAIVKQEASNVNTDL